MERKHVDNKIGVDLKPISIGGAIIYYEKKIPGPLIKCIAQSIYVISVQEQQGAPLILQPHNFPWVCNIPKLLVLLFILFINATVRIIFVTVNSKGTHTNVFKDTNKTA